MPSDSKSAAIVAKWMKDPTNKHDGNYVMKTALLNNSLHSLSNQSMDTLGSYQNNDSNNYMSNSNHNKNLGPAVSMPFTLAQMHAAAEHEKQRGFWDIAEGHDMRFKNKV